MLDYNFQRPTKTQAWNQFMRKRQAEGWRRVSLMLPPEVSSSIETLSSKAGVRPWQLIAELVRMEAERAARLGGDSSCPR